VKQILLTMNERETPGFIVEDLDDFHLLIKSEHEHRIRRELESEVGLIILLARSGSDLEA
jgi:TFIIH basal transcription factor complex TTD-A subunit